MIAEVDVEALGRRVDGLLERSVREWLDATARVVDEVVVMVIGIGDLEARDPVAAVEAVQQAARM